MRVFYFLKQIDDFTHKLKFSVFDSLVIGYRTGDYNEIKSNY